MGGIFKMKGNSTNRVSRKVEQVNVFLKALSVFLCIGVVFSSFYFLVGHKDSELNTFLIELKDDFEEYWGFPEEE